MLSPLTLAIFSAVAGPSFRKDTPATEAPFATRTLSLDKLLLAHLAGQTEKLFFTKIKNWVFFQIVFFFSNKERKNECELTNTHNIYMSMYSLKKKNQLPGFESHTD